MSLPELGDLLKPRGQLRQLAAPTKSLYRSELVVRCTARSDQVRMVGVCQAVRPRARGRHDRALFEEQDGTARAGKCECVGDRFDSLRVGDGVPSAVENAEAHTFFAGNAREELGTVDPCAADLEMRRAGPAERTAAEQRSPEIRSAAARARYYSPWRPLDRREAGREHAGLVEHLECAIVSGNVQLIPRASIEGVSCVRPDLGHDAERTQQTERSTRDRRVADVEMHGDLAAALQMHASRRMEEP
jgi:hypothetical protein